MTTFLSPPLLTGTEARKLETIRSYLFQLSDQLNRAYQSLSAENFASEDIKAVLSGQGEKKTVEYVDGQNDALRSLIIKTADTVRSEIDTLTATLKSDYVALSDYGTFTQQTTATLEANAAAITQNITDISTIRTSAEETENAFQVYVSETNAYIKQGIIRYDGTTPVVGIAIGQDITATGATEEVGGKTYDVIAITNSNMSVWTTEKLSFYINGLETAWFSNGALHANKIVAGVTLELGDKWEISHQNGFTVKWIGG